MWVEEYRNFTGKEIASGKRIGIEYAQEFAEMPWRFWVKGNPYVSRGR
jgi:DNA-3-methyladenine glycosylase